MASELWQRLREVRKFADKTQAEMAKIANITRSGYAFWENSDPKQRTLPNVDQIVAISKATGVPVAWLLDDKSDVNDLWRSGGPKAPAQAAEPEPAPYVAQTDRAQQRFWAAVEYAVTREDPAKDGSFGRVARAGAVELSLDYMHGNVAAVFSRSADDQDLVRTIGYLLTAARAVKANDLRILVNAPEAPSTGLIESARRFLGVAIEHVSSPEQAAEVLLAAK